MLTEAKSSQAEVLLADIITSSTNKMFRDDTDFTPEALADLSESIKTQGIAQPVLLRRDPGNPKKFILVAGERRVRASMLADLKTIPAYIRDLDEDQAVELQIIENLQREGVNPVKEAIAFTALIDHRKMSATMIANKIGKSVDYVHERLRLANVIKPIQDAIRLGDIPLKAGLKYSRIPKEQQKDAFEETVDTIMLNDKKQKHVFGGIQKLQDWMDNHLFLRLDLADFDREDPKLNPEMGSCTTCKHNVKNTEGLFSDMTTEAKCTLASCFRIKQINTYMKLKGDLKKRFPDAKVVFKKRDGSQDGNEVFRKGLVGEIKGYQAGEEISEAAGKKNPDAYIAIHIGLSHNTYMEPEDIEKYSWMKPKSGRTVTAKTNVDALPAAEKAKLTPEQIKQAAQKQKDDQLKAAHKELLEKRLLAREYSNKWTEANYKKALVISIAMALDNMGRDEAFPILKEFGVDFYCDYKKKSTLIKAAQVDLAEMFVDENYRHWTSMEQFEKTLENVDIDSLENLLFVTQCFGDRDLQKATKVDPAKIKKAAKEQTDAWWAEVIKKRKAEEVPSKAPTVKTAAQKSVAALVSKKKASPKTDSKNPADYPISSYAVGRLK